MSSNIAIKNAPFIRALSRKKRQKLDFWRDFWYNVKELCLQWFEVADWLGLIKPSDIKYEYQK